MEALNVYIKVLQAATEFLGDWHRTNVVAGEPTHARFFSIEATPHLVLSDSDARRLAAWESGKSAEPPEDLADLESARCGFEVVEWGKAGLTGESEDFRTAATGFLLYAEDAVRHHPGIAIGFAVVHTTSAPGGWRCISSKLFVPGAPQGHTKVDYWEPGMSYAGFTMHPWDSPVYPPAFLSYIPSPYFSSAEEIKAWGSAA